MFDTLAPEAAALTALAQARRAESAASARTLRLAADLVADRRRGPDREPVELVAVEVAVALGVSTTGARTVITLGEQLRDDFPALGRALARGELDLPKTRAVLDRVGHVTDPEVRARVEAQVLERVLGRCSTNGAVGAACDRVLAAVDPALVRQRARRAVEDREVRVSAAADGMAGLSGLLTAADGRVLDRTLDDMTREVCEHDPRTATQQRADALVALAVDGGSLRCRCGRGECVLNDPVPEDPARPRPRVVVHVVVAAETLAGAADLPGALRGLGVLDPDTVRRLAADATWRRLLTLDGSPVQLTTRPWAPGTVIESSGVDSTGVDGTGVDSTGVDGTGVDAAGRVPPALRRPTAAELSLCLAAPDPVLDPGVLRYEPSDALRALVHARDGHCRFPGCTVPAARCDVDHVVPFDHAHPERGGWTVLGNLGCLCRFHHRAKTAGVWAVTMAADGSQRWSGPAGQRLTSSPDALPPAVGEHGPPLPARDRWEASSHPLLPLPAELEQRLEDRATDAQHARRARTLDDDEPRPRTRHREPQQADLPPPADDLPPF